jgi:hypothetical protein
MINYSKAVIYKLYCKDNTVLEIYIGSSQDAEEREKGHKDVCNNENYEGYNRKVYIFIRANGGMDNWIFEVIERFPCENKIELVIREQYHYDLLKPALNTYKPYIPEEERKEEKRIYDAKYREDNKEEVAKYQEKYREDNKEDFALYNAKYYEEHKDENKKYYQENKKKFKEKHAKYKEENREKILKHSKQKHICICGGKYTSAGKLQHCNTNKHKSFIAKTV